MAAPGCVDYIIGGVKIQFPCKAYSSQLAMMNSIVRGLNNGQNCLLESPTGSGKSLALLCSTLGWQQGQHFKLQHGGVSQDEKSQTEKSSGDLKKSQTPCQCVCHSKTSKSSAAAAATPVVDLTVSPCKETKTQPAGNEDSQPKRQSIASRLSEKLQSTLQSEAERDDDFQPDRKRIRTADLKSRKKPRMDKGVIFLDDEPEFENHTSLNHRDTDEHNSPGTSHSPPGCVNEVCTKCPCDFGEEVTNKKPKIPKIFFGTRTHKQIKQITHELKRTLYSSVPMTILSSRDHSCVNADVAPHANRNERCKDLREAKEGYSCRYYHNVQKMRDQSTLQFVHGLHKAWDIEELVSLGKRIRACSYYAARELMQSANIVFCPYNYLLDPLIRESMEIDLSGQILVLDEAHNIEDCARECASYTLSLQSLHLCRDELESMISVNIRRAQHEPLRGFCYSLINWIQESQSLMSDRGYESASKVWGGREVVDIFRTLGITPDTFAMLEQNLASVMEKEERVIDEVVELPTISSASATVLKSIFMVLDFLYRGNSRFADDYRVALQKSYTWTNQAPPDVPDANGFIVRRQRQRQRSVRVKTEVLTLSFWCLNPAVAFSDLGDTVHSIVLTSGTLSPMGSFSSELGVKFTIQLEANHVINKSQVWVGTVGAGPQGRKLCATFQHTETYTFQDEVGELLLHVCQAVSKGVLCFLSSYKMLDKLRDRWVNTGLWEKLETLKAVITEPRGGGKGDFDELLQVYYDAIKYSDQRDGALLMAVCRGKVSEGLDFTDDNARAVVTIGIPFPNNRDLQVELKMKYNDQHCKTRGLLSGHRWYEIQAYRALNQALGRCIRHKNDWGALILVDERYRNNPNRYITGLSKWVRQLVHHHDSFPNAMQSLVAFSHQQRMRSEGGGSSESQTQSPSPSLGSPGSSMGMSFLKEPRTPLSVVDPVTTQRSPPPAAVQNNTRIKVNGEADLKTERSLMAPVCNSKTEVYPIFASSPINPCFRKPIFKEKDSWNSSFRPEPAPFVDTNARQPAFTVEDDKKTALAQATDTEILMQNGDLATESVKATTGEEPQLIESSDEEDETVFFTPELFEGEEMEEDQGSPEQTSVQRQKDEKEGQSFRARAEEIGEKEAGEEAAAGGGGEEEEEKEEEVEVSQSRQAESKLRRLSRFRQKNNSATQGERVGRVRRPQIQTRSSQRRREMARAERKEELNNKPNRRVSEDTRGQREKQNQMGVQVERCCKKSEPKTGIDDLEKDSMRENKENTTPKSSRCTVFDIVTPKQKEMGRLQREGPESVKSQEAKQKVIKIQRSCKQKRRRQRSSPKRKKPKVQNPCCLGLYCGSCGKELLRDAQGALKREACGSGHLSLLQKYKLKSSKMTQCCKCGSEQKSLSDNTEKLLVVQSNVFLKDLNKTLQPLCEEDTQTGYNAIWDPCAGSITRFLQCKGCLSKCPPPSVEPIAAEVHFPRDTAQDQMWLSPASVWRCSQIRIHS